MHQRDILVQVKAAKLLAQAEVVVYDDLGTQVTRIHFPKYSTLSCLCKIGESGNCD